MNRISAMPMIEKKLLDEFCNVNLLKNPRMSDIDDIIIKLAENYGTALNEDTDEFYYSQKISERAYHLIYMGNIVKTSKEGIEVKMPDYVDGDYLKQETIRYELILNRNLKRTHTTTERNKAVDTQKTAISIMNEDGIELQRQIIQESGRNRKSILYERVKQNPTIVRKTIDGEDKETFYDMGESDRIENIIVSKENKIDKEKIDFLGKEQRDSIIERHRFSTYIKGISKLLGLQINRPENMSR